jgi:hypothetical protein
MPRGQQERDRSFLFPVVACLCFFSAVKMGSFGFFELLVKFCWTVRCHIPVDSILHTFICFVYKEQIL